MKKFIYFIVIAIIIVGIAVVAIPELRKSDTVVQGPEVETVDTNSASLDDESDRLAFWFQHHDSLNHGLVSVAEELWKLDSAAAHSSTIGRAMWYEKCQKRLVACFDSIHPRSNLSEIQKADSMLTEIAAFFEQDADYTTMGMIVNLDLQNDFIIYRLTAEGSQIMKYEPTFAEELNAWDGLQEAMFSFCLSVVNWDWFGGSGAGPASLAEQNTILQCRLDDLKRVHKQYSREFPIRLYSQDNIEKDIDAHLLKAKAEFKKSVDKVASSIAKDEDVKDYLAKEQLEAYYDLYDKIQTLHNQLIKAFDEWLKVRNRFQKDESNVQKVMKIRYKENTAIMIDSLAKCIADSKTEG